MESEMSHKSVLRASVTNVAFIFTGEVFGWLEELNDPVGFATPGAGANIFSSGDDRHSGLTAVSPPVCGSFFPFHLSKPVVLGICFGIEEEDMK